MGRKRQKFLRGAVVGLVSGLVVVVLQTLGLFDRVEAPTWDWRVRLFAAREELDANVAIILIDQPTLEWGERENGWGWPWPREVYGAIASFCERGGARALAIDLIFTESSVYGVPDDQALGEALLGVDLPTVLSVVPGGNRSTWSSALPRPLPPGDGVPARAVSTLMFPVNEIGAEMPLGHVAGRPDADGVFRRMIPFVRFDGSAIPVLGLSVWQAAAEIPPPKMTRDGDLDFGPSQCRLDESGAAILRFRDREVMHNAISAAAIIQSELRLRAGENPVVNPELLRGKYVFLGGSAPGIRDLRPTPVDPKAPGVLLHATFVDNLLTDSFMALPGWPLLAGLILAVALVVSMSLVYVSKWWQTVALAAFWLVVPIGIAMAAYAGGVWWPLFGQEAGVGLAIAGALAANYWAEGRQKNFLKGAFRHYLSGEVIDAIVQDPGRLTLGGERRELSIMFTDLAGFSGISERLSPVELTSLLNDYLSEMTDIIMDEGGTLDKYEGDAIIAFWNAPLPQADHAGRACRAAIRCQCRLAELRAAFTDRAGVDLRMRIGINTGEVVVGNMGSRKRFNYTILGDAANLASRLEGANKAFGTETMVSDATWRRVEDRFVGRELADLRVVGRSQPVKVYELTGYRGTGLSASRAVVDSVAPPTRHPSDAVSGQSSEQALAADGSTNDGFAAGLAAFRRGDFGGAAKIFGELAADDPAAQAYAARCEDLLADPPDLWDGVWTLEVK